MLVGGMGRSIPLSHLVCWYLNFTHFINCHQTRNFYCSSSNGCYGPVRKQRLGRCSSFVNMGCCESYGLVRGTSGEPRDSCPSHRLPAGFSDGLSFCTTTSLPIISFFVQCPPPHFFFARFFLSSTSSCGCLSVLGGICSSSRHIPYFGISF